MSVDHPTWTCSDAHGRQPGIMATSKQLIARSKYSYIYEHLFIHTLFIYVNAYPNLFPMEEKRNGRHHCAQFSMK
ncbi:unnamed protein product [Amoebophrya sp. A25]|nr:unnamed protein product [Amoebophrya sp. A25]|eukprot:GSA25T00016180001.1